MFGRIYFTATFLETVKYFNGHRSLLRDAIYLVKNKYLNCEILGSHGGKCAV
jgi:hypothetical protein